MKMTNDEAANILKNVAWLGTNHQVGEVEEAVKLAIEALEKQIPKKPEYKEEDRFVKNHFAWYAYCPQCGREIDTGDMHCTQCGQAIDWSDEDDE